MAFFDFLSAPSLKQIEALLDSRVAKILNLLKNMPTNAEHEAALTALTDQVTKSKAEIVKRIADLEAAVAAAGGTSPGVDTAFANLKAAVQGVDDLNQDA